MSVLPSLQTYTAPGLTLYQPVGITTTPVLSTSAFFCSSINGLPYPIPNIVASTINTSSIQASTLTVNNTIRASASLSFNISSINSLSVFPDGVAVPNRAIISSISANEVSTKQLLVSTINGLPYQGVENNIVASTITTSTIQTNTLGANALQISTLGANALLASTINTSSIQASTLGANALQASTINTSSIQASTLTVNNTILAPTSLSFNISSINSLSVFPDGVAVPNRAIISSITANEVSTKQLLVSSINGSPYSPGQSAIFYTLPTSNYTIGQGEYDIFAISTNPGKIYQVSIETSFRGLSAPNTAGFTIISGQSGVPDFATFQTVNAGQYNYDAGGGSEVTGPYGAMRSCTAATFVAASSNWTITASQIINTASTILTFPLQAIIVNQLN
jgi:hypothetical protein